MEQAKTRIPVRRRLRDLLRSLKRGGETYDEVLVRLIEDSAELDGGRAGTIIGTTGESVGSILAKDVDNNSLDTQAEAGTSVSSGEQNEGSSDD